ncbi:2-methylaconitate cis-trans isomerase PrpF family protein [Spirosoma rhododendri]|uniref:4-oxalomesaconate tautomerase n=1 Tax=Spirosoma rhododendri TaxID=2728024 RepID=A0A7L5DQH7_9BACT|nr:PrpF domain-containing protein [Spirosoma rhododendri]QJD80714.1 4-oxalomesaconate tautomerase [Spirosoma rhododendri]
MNRFALILIGLAYALTSPLASLAQSSPAPANAIPCVFMRGGTSRGPFLDLRDLPRNRAQRDSIILRIMGSPDARQIDGLGGAETVTSKVVMAQPSTRPGIDVDYLFAQVDLENPLVDTLPPCGNMMAGVGPFAIEKGWVKATSPETKVMIYNINTNSVIEEVIQTPNGRVQYSGNAHIDGVPGTAAPVLMNLFDQVGGKTKKLLPTGQRKEKIDGLDVSILDAGTVMVLLRADALGLTGGEDEAFFKNNKALMERLERIRREAGKRAGLGDVSNSVLPKIGILSKAQGADHNIRSRYLTPHALHPSHAVTGAICIGTALKIGNTVASEVGRENGKPTELVVIEHPSGVIEINIELDGQGDQIQVRKVGTMRTARKLMQGYVFY